MELEPYGINFLSAQDLSEFYWQEEIPHGEEQKQEETKVNYHKKKKNKSKSKKTRRNQPKIEQIENKKENKRQRKIEKPNIYQMVEYFMSSHPNGHYFCDEVPLITGTTSNTLLY